MISPDLKPWTTSTTVIKSTECPTESSEARKTGTQNRGGHQATAQGQTEQDSQQAIIEKLLQRENTWSRHIGLRHHIQDQTMIDGQLNVLIAMKGAILHVTVRKNFPRTEIRIEVQPEMDNQRYHKSWSKHR